MVVAGWGRRWLEPAAERTTTGIPMGARGEQWQATPQRPGIGGGAPAKGHWKMQPRGCPAPRLCFARGASQLFNWPVGQADSTDLPSHLVGC